MNTYTNTQPVYRSAARYTARPKGRKGAIARLTVLTIVSIIGILSSICTLPGFVESRGLGPAILEAIGGCGTLIASLASLITFRTYTTHYPEKTRSYIGLFTALNFGFLAVLTLVSMCLV